MPDKDVVIKKIEAQQVAALRGIIPTYSEVGPLWGELCGYLGENKAQWAGPPVAVYYDMEYKERDVDVEIAVPIAGPVAGTDRIKVKELPAIETAACLIHQGPYENFNQSYQALLTWADANGYQVAGPDREVYLKGPEEGRDPSEYITELQLPIEKK